MPQNKNVRTYDLTILKMMYEAQQSINHGYDPKSVEGSWARAAEGQTADFFEDYASGEAVIDAEAEPLLADYIAIAKNSQYYRIKNVLKKAEDKYKLAQITHHKDEEKKKAFAETRFKILNNKKEAIRLSSKDMIMIAELLEAEQGYSTVKMQDKLKSFAVEKINRTLNGEMPQDEGFAELAEAFGTYQQKSLVRTRIDKGMPIARKPEAQKKEVTNKPQRKQETKIPAQEESRDIQINQQPEMPANIFMDTNKSVKPAPKAEEKTKKKEKAGFFQKNWRAIKRAAVVIGIGVLGYLAGKTVQEFTKDTKQDNKENVAKPKLQAYDNTTEKTADFSKYTKQDNKKDTSFSQEAEALNKAYKNRFDTALKIVLGENGRDQLYQEVDKLAQDGKIEFSNGTTREWYAHAFTMYNQLAPNSKEAKAIKKLRNGGTADKGYINSLVIQAGRDGKGIKASGTFSHFDKADKSLQQKHIKNRKAVKAAEQAMAKAKAGQLR